MTCSSERAGDPIADFRLRCRDDRSPTVGERDGGLVDADVHADVRVTR